MLTKRFNVSDQGNFYVFAYIGLILTLAQGLLVRRLIPKLGEFRLALIGVALMTVGLLLLGFTAKSGTLGMLILILPVVVIGFSATTPSLQAMLSLNSRDDEQGEVLGIGPSISSLALIGGPVVGMTLQAKDQALPYWFGSLLMAVGVVMVFRLKSVIKGRSSDVETVPAGH